MNDVINKAGGNLIEDFIHFQVERVWCILKKELKVRCHKIENHKVIEKPWKPARSDTDHFRSFCVKIGKEQKLKFKQVIT